MTPSRSTSGAQPSETPVSQKRFFSPRLIAGIGIMLAVLLVAGITFATQKISLSQAASLGKKADHDAITTINGLKKITMVGKTDQIINAHGKTITVDPNPYGIAISDGSNGLKKGRPPGHEYWK